LLKRLRSLAGAFGARFGWNWIGFALGLGIVSVYVLSHLLQDIAPSRVLAAARATALRSIASAVFFIACAYGTLTLYDFFALRVIGEHLRRPGVGTVAAVSSARVPRRQNTGSEGQRSWLR
jgi:uncharacterized membrane protein YbhN (UPF0104 family)